ncbi:MAG: RNA methyltransferase [Lachnospiraceae bacterium]|nr:RNA methyltransferase [Lachnospiraceae bacterium]
MITSASNKKVKNIAALLSRSRERKKQGVFVVEGIKMFTEAPIDRILEVYIEETLFQEILAGKSDEEFVKKLDQITGCLQKKDGKNCAVENNGISVGFEIVRDDIFRKMSDTQTPQGILCVVKRMDETFEDLMKETQMKEYQETECQEKDKHQKDNQKKDYQEKDGQSERECAKGLYLILEDIQDPGNLGTMIRAGEGAGVSGIIMSDKTVDVYNPKTIRATMGSIYRVPFCYVSDLHRCIKDLQECDIKVYAAHLKGEEAYDLQNYCRSVAFLIGNEGNGLKDETAELADAYIKIPMLGKVESLNAAIAATLLVYEAARQRRN